MSKKLTALLLAVVLILASMPMAFAEEMTTMYVYTENGLRLNVRAGKSSGAPVVGKIAYGSAVTVLGSFENGWARISFPGARYSDGSVYTGNCYVSVRFLVRAQPAPYDGRTTPIPTVDPAPQNTLSAINAEFRTAVRVNPYVVLSRPQRASGWVNLRWAPSTDAECISRCYQGHELVVLTELRNWLQVQDPVTGMIGFIMRRFVTVK